MRPQRCARGIVMELWGFYCRGGANVLSTELVEESSCIQGLGINTVLVSHYKGCGRCAQFHNR